MQIEIELDGDADVRTQVRKFIAENIVMTAAAARLADDSSLLAHNLLDSTSVIELCTFLEQTFGIVVADDEMVPANLDSVGLITSFVERKRGAR
jgi:acyl carrier protein